ncbi:PqiC family protein [Endozoicomonas euniceicola]|uniref:PqiC family protein n=1 Tax=Endozoicomonas euniceicola TaxID=1234143 RepID=A0ABY6GSI0_9GAMM|nr:PqiC family protein [Endozoicomonas euniceicola]UYM15354.1 PqiC family protein [Endozoicomonas euniceicola]
MKIVLHHSLAVLMVLLLAGCASSAPYRYYTLQPMAEQQEAGLTGSVGIMPVVIPSWLDRSNMAYIDDGFQLHQLRLDRWGEPLAEAITRVLTQNLQRKNPQADVFHGPWLRSQRPDTDIQAEIQNLMLKGRQLELEVSWRINDERRVEYYKVVVSEQPSAFELAKAISGQLQQFSDDLQHSLVAGS